MCNEQRAALHPSWMFYGSFFRCSCFVWFQLDVVSDGSQSPPLLL